MLLKLLKSNSWWLQLGKTRLDGGKCCLSAGKQSAVDNFTFPKFTCRQYFQEFSLYYCSDPFIACFRAREHSNSDACLNDTFQLNFVVWSPHFSKIFRAGKILLPSTVVSGSEICYKQESWIRLGITNNIVSGKRLVELT